MSDEEYPDGTLEAREKALAQGMEVIDGDDFKLLLDLDTPESIAQYERMRHYVEKPYMVSRSDKWTSKSGVGQHVVVHLGEPTDIKERIALQLILGSDKFREFLSLRDICDGHEHPIMLFKPAAVVEAEKSAKLESDKAYEEIFGELAI